jgi:enoyl-CoA hydratase/carnithine racemase
MATVLSDVEENVGSITLNRPDAMNAITIELAQALEAALLDLGTRARVIVIRGAGGNFCVGGDFKALQALQAEGREATRELFASFHRACAAVSSLDVPVIAAVEGFAMAGGFELMQACDFSLVRADAELADTHSNHTMIPGGGSTQRLPRLVGRQRALAHILTGDRLSGAEAVEWGLAYRAFDADAFESGVAAIAQRLASKSPAALARSKRLVYEGLRLPLSEGIELELETVLEHLNEHSFNRQERATR